MAAHIYANIPTGPHGTVGGGYNYKYLKEPPDQLICPVCNLVARDPQQMDCCGHVYCKDCLDGAKKTSSLCSHCGRQGSSFPDIRADLDIKSLMVKCERNDEGCVWEGELQYLAHHLTTDCDYVLVSCPNECGDNLSDGISECSDIYGSSDAVLTTMNRFPRGRLEYHLKDECPRRSYICPVCGREDEFRIIDGEHVYKCPLVAVKCPKVCGAELRRFELEEHKMVCMNEEVLCKFSEKIGCEVAPKRRDLAVHESNSTYHFQLAIDRLVEMEKCISELQVQVAPLVMKIHCQEFDAPLSSPEFYSHRKGYRLQLRIFKEADHISAFIYIKKGKNDASLVWPFRGEVTIELLNQLEDHNHHFYVLKYSDTEEDAHNCQETENSVGWGGRYMLCSDLIFNETKNCQYLKDDHLYFRVSVKLYDSNKPWLLQ